MSFIHKNISVYYRDKKDDDKDDKVSLNFIHTLNHKVTSLYSYVMYTDTNCTLSA